MTSPPNRSAIERLASSIPAAGTLAAVAAYAGTPLAALLPVLGQTLAAERQRQRIEGAIANINQVLQAQGEKLQRLTDEQFKLINETILAIFHSTSAEKISLLTLAVRNELDISLAPFESVFLSRALRDISPEEVQFLSTYFQFRRIQLTETTSEHDSDTLSVSPSNHEGRLVVGLIQLGLIIPAEQTYDDSGLLRFSPFASKLLSVVATR